MNVIKKLLAAVLLLSLCMNTYAAIAVKDDIPITTRICRDLGYITGTAEEGVTPEYAGSIPTRIQAARIYLRIFDLEKAAMAYEGTENFMDADKVSAEEQKIMAYLKAHPEHGFIGNPDGSFHPNEPMTAQAYYKLLLTTLGYDAQKDFSWNTVFDFAREKGMSQLTADDNSTFTIDKLCAATIEGLKANLKDGSQSLVQSLVEKGIIDPKVIKSGLF
jgi:hypothetical protein